MVFAVGEFGDVDPGPTKDAVMKLQDDPEHYRLFELSFGKRPAEELYDIEADPQQLHNLAGNTEWRGIQDKLRSDLEHWMSVTADPRAAKDDDHWDQYSYYGKPGREMAPIKAKP
jgi:N-sulfoglucosamine sulfohydrolase